MERRGHFDSIVPSLVYILTKQHGVCGGKRCLKTTFNAIYETLNYEMSLDALALKNLFLSGEFQIHPLFIISPLLAFQKQQQQQQKMTNAHFGRGIGQLGID